jgi:predicted type IV restriction endonuclease
MGFVEDIAKHAERVQKFLAEGRINGEAQTRSALIDPFLASLGYDIHDPGEVIPEYASDPTTMFNAGAKGRDKVDYAIALNGTVVMLIEAKAWDQKLDKHHTQLGQYFTWTTSARLSLVTNGFEYRFFTDLGVQNIMDTVPFFQFNLLDYSAKDLEILEIFHRDNFSTEAITKHAERLVYVEGMTKLVGSILRDPSDEFVRFLVKSSPEFNQGNIINARVVAKFQPIIKSAIQNAIVQMMTSSLTREMDAMPASEAEEEPDAEFEFADVRVVTTAEELAAFEKIKAIVGKSSLGAQNLNYKDVESYFGVHVGKPGWWFLRLYLGKRKSVVVRLPIADVRLLAYGLDVQEVSTAAKEATRVMISSIDDLDRLTALILKAYEAEMSKHSIKQAAAV